MYYEDYRDAMRYLSLPPTVTAGGLVIPNPVVPPPGDWLDECLSRSNENIQASIEQATGF